MLQNKIRTYGRGRRYNYIADSTDNEQTNPIDQANPIDPLELQVKKKTFIPVLESALEGESISASNISELALAKLEMLALEKLRLGFGLTGGDIGLKGAMKGVTDR